jgi:hypothetical protein
VTDRLNPDRLEFIKQFYCIQLTAYLQACCVPAMVLHAYIVHVSCAIMHFEARMERRWGVVSPARGQRRQCSVTWAAS